MNAQTGLHHTAFLGLGSNLGDKRQNLKLAFESLESAEVYVEATSPIYATEPLDFKDQDWFLNQVIRVSTPLNPEALLACCAAVEETMGRQRKVPKGPRIIDIDILLFDDSVLNTEKLTLPH